MRDTPPEVDTKYRALLLERSGEERLKMAGSMYATARALVVASVLEKDPLASPSALRREVFLRFYGDDFDAKTRERILARLGDQGRTRATLREEATMSLLRFTGHPLADVGIATLCAMAGREGPAALTLSDLDQMAEELRAYYFSGLMTSYLSCVFMNAEYVQPGSGKGKEKKRADYADRVLRAHRWPAEERAQGLQCAYSREPATHLVHRSQVPLLTGEDVLNFFPAGQGGLPVAGPYLAAIQALPMGGRRAEGRLLIVHSDDPELTLALARKYVADNRRLLNLARSNKLPAKDGPDPILEREHAMRAQSKDGNTAGAKYPDAKGPTSLVAADLLEISLAPGSAETPSSVTVYVMSNSGQGPSLEIHTIPSNLVRFLRLVNSAGVARSWRDILARSWRDPLGKDDRSAASGKGVAGKGKVSAQAKRHPKAKGKLVPTVAGGPGRSKNDVLEDLFRIFDAGFTDLRAARRFVRRHLLRDVHWSVGQALGRSASTGLIEPSLVDWTLTELFLTEVMGMDAKRIERIKEFADGLAKHIGASHDGRLFRDVVFGRRPWEVRNALTKAQRNEAREHDRLLFGLQEYLDVFESDDAVGMADWALTRDLISIRLVESLHESGFFKDRADLLTEVAGEDSAEA